MGGRGGLRKLVTQMGRFAVVGVTAFSIDYGMLMFLSQAIGMNPVLAAAVSFVVSLTFNYVASMRFVFTHKEGTDRRREFLVFVCLSVVGLAINEACMAIGVNLLGGDAMHVTMTKAFATAVVMTWNFVSRKLALDAS